jgi:hypothetical protein
MLGQSLLRLVLGDVHLDRVLHLLHEVVRTFLGGREEVGVAEVAAVVHATMTRDVAGDKTQMVEHLAHRLKLRRVRSLNQKLQLSRPTAGARFRNQRKIIVVVIKALVRLLLRWRRLYEASSFELISGRPEGPSFYVITGLSNFSIDMTLFQFQNPHLSYSRRRLFIWRLDLFDHLDLSIRLPAE